MCSLCYLLTPQLLITWERLFSFVNKKIRCSLFYVFFLTKQLLAGGNWPYFWSKEQFISSCNLTAICHCRMHRSYLAADPIQAWEKGVREKPIKPKIKLQILLVLVSFSYSGVETAVNSLGLYQIKTSPL